MIEQLLKRTAQVDGLDLTPVAVERLKERFPEREDHAGERGSRANRTARRRL